MTHARKKEINRAWTYAILFGWLFLAIFLISVRATTVVHAYVINETSQFDVQSSVYPFLISEN